MLLSDVGQFYSNYIYEHFVGFRYGLNVTVILLILNVIVTTTVRCALAPYVDIVMEWSHTIDDDSESYEDCSPEVSEPNDNHVDSPGKHLNRICPNFTVFSILNKIIIICAN